MTSFKFILSKHAYLYNSKSVVKRISTASSLTPISISLFLNGSLSLTDKALFNPVIELKNQGAFSLI